jgi:hypothetical protein
MKMSFPIVVAWLSLALLKPTTALATDYNIVKFGAVSGQLCTQAIQKAIDACHAEGGGRVLFPEGVFISGTLFLKSNVDIHLSRNAILKGSDQVAHYTVNGRVYGLVYCEDATNVAITGTGTIDANGSQFYDPTQNHTYDEFDRSATRQKDGYMPVGTFFTDGPIKRKVFVGNTLEFFHCSRVSLLNLHIKDTPVWATRFGYCDGVLIDNISIANNLLVPNSDGIHCTASRNIRIANCQIVAGDDAIVLTGFTRETEQPGYGPAEQARYQHGNKTIYAENLTVTNCQLQSASSGIRIGYGQHPIRRCVFTNLVISDSHRGIGIFAHDASDIEDLIFSDIVIETRLRNGQWWGHGEPIHLSCISRFAGQRAGQIKNVQFNNIIATGEQGILVYGLPDSPLANIEFNQVRLRLRKGKETLTYGGNFDLRPATPRAKQIFAHDIPGFYAQHVNGLAIRQCALTWDADLPSFFTHGIECEHVTDLWINDFAGGPNPNAPGGKKIQTTQCTLRK